MDWHFVMDASEKHNTLLWYINNLCWVFICEITHIFAMHSTTVYGNCVFCIRECHPQVYITIFWFSPQLKKNACESFVPVMTQCYAFFLILLQQVSVYSALSGDPVNIATLALCSLWAVQHASVFNGWKLNVFISTLPLEL